jgi:hypothetical protein
MTPARLLAAAASTTLAACAHILPESSVDSRAAFDSFGAARQAIERIEPYKTRLGELKALGFDVDVDGQRNVTLITYPELVARLAPNSAVALEDLDPGIRECILARTTCVVYGLHFLHEKRERRGGFFSDFFNFERTTVVTAWRFDAIIAVHDDLVLFRSFSGEPDSVRVEHQRNPLGPLQSAGDSLIGVVAR